MKAAYYNRFGSIDVLNVGDLPAPRPARGEVLVRVAAAALNPKDVLVRKGKFRLISGRRFPRIPGYDLAGTVEQVGAGVSDIALGDEVYGMVNSWSGGTCAELVALPAGELASRPPSLSMEEAAATPLAALTALQALRDLLDVRSGDRVAINGASGGVGLFAVQIASLLGGRVVAVCSARNADLVREVGASEVIPYDERDQPTPGRRFDAFFDVFGNRPSPRVRSDLSKPERHVTTVPSGGAILRDLTSRLLGRSVRFVSVKSNRRDLEQLTRWIDAGELRPVVDRICPLEDSADAHAYLETRRARGKVVLTVGRQSLGRALCL